MSDQEFTQIRAVYEWTDGAGNVHRPAPSMTHVTDSVPVILQPGERVISRVEMLRTFSDDVIEAEMNRRGLGLAEMDSATLLEACKSRGLTSTLAKTLLAQENAENDRHCAAMAKERDFERNARARLEEKLAEAQDGGIADDALMTEYGRRGMADQHIRMVMKERDAWKARAEKAEHEAKELEGEKHGWNVTFERQRDTIHAICRHQRGVTGGLCRDCGDPSCTSPLHPHAQAPEPRPVPHFENQTRGHFVDWSQESGPGISRLPEKHPEPMAFLPEDLLCEDVS